MLRECTCVVFFLKEYRKYLCKVFLQQIQAADKLACHLSFIYWKFLECMGIAGASDKSQYGNHSTDVLGFGIKTCPPQKMLCHA